MIPALKIPHVSVLPAVILLLMVILVQFTYRKDPGVAEAKAIVLRKAAEFEKHLQLLQQTAREYHSGKVTAAAVQKQFLETRLVYKQVAFLLTYYYPEHIKEYINGAPLPHLDPYPYEEIQLPETYYQDTNYIRLAPLDYLEPNAYLKTRKVLAPRGMQVMDELIFSEALAGERDKLLTLTDELAFRSRIMLQALYKRRYIQAHELMEAARLEMVRLFTLGITGFDTPGSLHALPEAKASLAGMFYTLKPLLTALPIHEQNHLLATFSGAMQYLEVHHDFNTFDRLAFLTRYINPLYRLLLEAHQALGLVNSSALTVEEPSWNFFSQNIFAEDFLNPYYYSLLQKEQDSERLRGLGKTLFYDKRLSSSTRMSCGSCHQPALAFTDGKAKSLASVEGQVVKRNAPSLINAVYADRYFYDLRAFDLEEQLEHVVVDHLEFNTSFDALVEKLNADTAYRQSFNQAFRLEGKPITRYQFSAALASYVLSLRSFNSRFDQYVRGEREEISEQVRHGFNLFMGKAACGTCHFAPLFSGLVPPLYQENESEVLGVMEKPGSNKVDDDAGRAAGKAYQENVEIYHQSFKTVSIRNAGLTAPYFHNGAYKTLEEVLDFYDHGGAGGLGFSYEVPHQTLPPDSLHLNPAEKKAIIAFLHSLSDTTFTENTTAGQISP
ncbi:cytochrome-c peroxidase [Cesiribacter sp. SM1]|uniref:cytochrome-c peroxidase n=1 Tax=Cesiribacter sp. SM1 TaxID=2861196 RepID=UPI001CD2CFDD|nr:cytochrome c peroxidase [Cesiribacter sp. SM1]